MSKIDIVLLLNEFRKWCEQKGLDMNGLLELYKAIQLSWGFKEENVSQYTFKELLGYLQAHAKEDKHNGAAVIKEHDSSGKIILKVMLLDKNDEPIKALGSTYLVVYANSLDSDLESRFGDKDMIVIK
ncbi:hypothetical protein DCO58_09075 [Helicobacter saguini]|uniref:Uncharacterized protein n=1 Tax=Helicobacter saguini TaxID=1548018 RepID=A0A347VP35_9HELI|nr:hypothetical protein [Helicobacter saguini]MWV61529.1 hypothetical protein [Helicobacter saguini]MWV67801.1 hypothetical protein [Helicobacter saguini]MWV70731.1 hypothetical protein [Helicobacter saguini]MWV72634.1 hypothetical protein [Helicobacter saguini]TLD94559.1 hypothetical protein LS64_005175 [Helicobacter saguini]